MKVNEKFKKTLRKRFFQNLLSRIRAKGFFLLFFLLNSDYQFTGSGKSYEEGIKKHET